MERRRWRVKGAPHPGNFCRCRPMTTIMLDFRKLDAYRYAVALLELVSLLADEVPRPQRALASELLRAALSVLRSLAEGSHRQPASRPEARHCYGFARGSVFDCIGLVDTLANLRAI